jgi:hypothetical protein
MIMMKRLAIIGERRLISAAARDQPPELIAISRQSRLLKRAINNIIADAISASRMEWNLFTFCLLCIIILGMGKKLNRLFF